MKVCFNTEYAINSNKNINPKKDNIDLIKPKVNFGCLKSAAPKTSSAVMKSIKSAYQSVSKMLNRMRKEIYRSDVRFPVSKESK